MAKLFFSFAIAFALTFLLVHAQNQSGFISIDCGASEDYTDEITGIEYSSDIGYTDTGESKNVSLKLVGESVSRQYLNVRSFPEGQKNCYKLKPPNGKNHSYLIRAGFMYGNYDGLEELPEFDLYLGVNKWRTVKFEEEFTTNQMEVIHFLLVDHVNICLVKTSSYTPFISFLELRPLIDETYVAQSGSLQLFTRLDSGLTSQSSVRYREDVFDRIWSPFNFDAWEIINGSQIIQANTYEPPSLVMSTAVTPTKGNNSFGFTWNASADDELEETPEFYIYLHFSELEDLGDSQTREFNIYLNNKLWYGPFAPNPSSVSTIYSRSGVNGSSHQIMFNATENSTLPPLLNAFEIYSVKHFLSPETNQKDADAILNVKSTYKLSRNWQGDPCLPSAFMWEGLTCNFTGSDPPRIISLNLSLSGLTGVIDPYISNLTLIEKLDLSNNSLSGPVPDFLSNMSSLKFLNLEGNNFSGTLPTGLLERSKNGSINLRAEGNSYLCFSTTCEKNEREETNKKTKIIIIVGASIGGFMLLLITSGVAIFFFIRKRKQANPIMRKASSSLNRQSEELPEKKVQFTYSEILSITNNYARILGKGGFGTVYHGYLNDKEVAVKMLSPPSVQGYINFHNEAKLLTSVHHGNLTALVGYCGEGANLGLLYEFMCNGDLAWVLSDKNENRLNWEERLQIAVDTAEGLEYLHCGCEPPIVHRDVKTTNILLNERLEAKLSDFGFSRAFPVESGSHESTIVVGTPGYVDPQYDFSSTLTVESDVFSFGVVLLEIITGRPAISKNGNGKYHVIKWVNLKLSEKDIKSIVDPRLEQDYNENSVWKALEVAMACAAPTPEQRPTINRVITDLKQCSAMEMARKNCSGKLSEDSDLSLRGR